MGNRASAVLVVDAVNEYLGTESDRAEGGAVVSAAVRVISAARSTGVHVVHTRLRFRSDGIDGGHYFRRNPDLAAFAGRTAVAVAPLAETEDELFVPRTYPSPFFATSLSATLRGIEADIVILIGATTSEGIRAAAIDAMQHGFDAVVVADAVTDPSADQHARALAELADRYADVVSSDDAVALILSADKSRSADTEDAPWN